MLCIKHPNTNAYFNLAAEEYVLRNFSQDAFMLWRNEPAVIVGKHQNTLGEINLDFIKESEIKVVRRLSGGGAVFHDLGNLNFTFIMNGDDGNLVDFRKFTKPILDVLLKLGIEAKFEGRNDLTIDGKKFSGNAEHVYKKRVLHHGTLLFSSQMADLSEALKINPLKYRDKAVKSVRSRVTNISDHLHQPLKVLEFRDLIMDHIRDMYPDAVGYDYSHDDLQSINNLVDNKYSTWEWNFGYSPMYDFQRGIKTEGGHIEFHLNVEKGMICDIKIYGDFFNKTDITELELLLKGCPHEQEAVKERLSSIVLSDYCSNVLVDEFVKGMF
ncbi:lipoate--protein ligase [Williamwhitmania taraxaci]|uniref:lipoate--protein ligase n=1 Tax=Williamwhitmania taraxaci TaxID=1640674 RepID=A0A1G6I2X5_9BACT|nr:lipoate--protein ligase [Williamwhitmania taraxaci]SDC00899.1 lipoate-protein ligase [Williamwhitmania taraxaci]